MYQILLPSVEAHPSTPLTDLMLLHVCFFLLGTLCQLPLKKLGVLYLGRGSMRSV